MTRCCQALRNSPQLIAAGNDVRIQGNPVNRDRRIEPQSIAENSWLQLQLVSLRMDFRATRFERAISCSQSTSECTTSRRNWIKRTAFYRLRACIHLQTISLTTHQKCVETCSEVCSRFCLAPRAWPNSSTPSVSAASRSTPRPAPDQPAPPVRQCDRPRID